MFSLPAETQAGDHRSFPSHFRRRLAVPSLVTILALIVQPLDSQALAAEVNSRPNIVLIMADDLGFAYLGMHHKDRHCWDRHCWDGSRSSSGGIAGAVCVLLEVGRLRTHRRNAGELT